MARHVKGTLFVNYVRMIKRRKDIDWRRHLAPADLPFIDGQRIESSQWYPFETFERMGLAILREIARGRMEAVRAWGRTSVDMLLAVYKQILALGDPAETAERFDVVRAGFFDFPGMRIKVLSPTAIRLVVCFTDDPLLSEAQAHQAVGALERLLELAGAEEIAHTFLARVGPDEPETVVELSWLNP